ncbi:MAG TPA: MBOAT family O-acyltransferase [Puia sp.]|nr:MBOAT family O-acyltransferase [Puia sp.]
MKLQVIFIIVVLIISPLIWRLPNYWKPKVMMLATLVILGWFALLSVLIMLAVAILQWIIWRNNYFGFRRAGVFLTILLPLLPLLFYKSEYKFNHWIIPLGLSFYAFRQVHVAFECYKSQMKKPGLLEYFEYLLFLPVMLIGPIHRMPEFQRSLRRQKWDPFLFSEGLERLLYGLVKINFIGNFLFAKQLIQLSTHVDSNFLKLYLETISFTGNAYFQFAGFSDLAIGMGLLWGIRVMENFNSPFLATNMQDFWQRWHISLSSWCRDYVFYPLAALTRQRWFALIVSMLVLALWHEISLRYILWGSLQALLILITVRTRKMMPAFSGFINDHPLGKWIGRFWVIHAFAFSCIFIGTENIQALSAGFKHLFS